MNVLEPGVEFVLGLVELSLEFGTGRPAAGRRDGGFDFVGFRLPFKWNGDWFVTDIPSQVAMRFLPNLFMSLSIVCVFYFFARFF